MLLALYVAASLRWQMNDSETLTVSTGNCTRVSCVYVRRTVLVQFTVLHARNLKSGHFLFTVNMSRSETR